MSVQLSLFFHLSSKLYAPPPDSKCFDWPESSAPLSVKLVVPLQVALCVYKATNPSDMAHCAYVEAGDVVHPVVLGLAL